MGAIPALNLSRDRVYTKLAGSPNRLAINA